VLATVSNISEIVKCAIHSFARKHIDQIDISAPLDAFWTRTGFQFVYERYPEQFPTRFLGDSRRYGGELAMRIGDIVPAVLRTRRPLARQQTVSQFSTTCA
jgi:hypothetical protein